MRAVVLVGHGSLRLGAGAAMIRLAARLRETGAAPIVAAGFLNYSRPSFSEAVARCLAQGGRDLVVQPYFLVPGVFVSHDLPRLVAAQQHAHPRLSFQVAAPLGDHPALARLVLARSAAMLPPTQPLCRDDGLLLMAHGSPDPRANASIKAIARRIAAHVPGLSVQVAYLDLNQPLLADAIDTLVAGGVQRIVAAPYFLQRGRHVAADIPAIIAAARLRHPDSPLFLAGHLGYDPLLAQVIADRVKEAAVAEEAQYAG